jgi:hypothetical protein
MRIGEEVQVHLEVPGESGHIRAIARVETLQESAHSNGSALSDLLLLFEDINVFDRGKLLRFLHKVIRQMRPL